MSRADFQWMTGFECSAFPQIGADELEETQHYRWWASDLARVREVGITLIRYGIPWHRVNPRPHEYDWSWTDQAVDLLGELGITPIVDLFHYGTPLWIEGGIMNPIFGEMQGWYAKAFATRYPHLLYYTPTNEPYIEATFGAEWAIWYPFLRGDANAVRAIKNVTEGLARAMIEIRRIQPQALMMIADTCEYYHSVEGAFQEEADFRTERRFLVHDLYQGLVTRAHPMWAYMVRYGLTEEELDWFLEHPVRLDILGLDYYKHSEHQLRRGPNGERIDETAQKQWGWAEMARQYSTRYGGIPVVLAETNVGGPVADRVAWFEQIVAQTRQARAAGTPIAGLTYYGAIDHVDWDTALRVRNLNINPCGMWSLEWRGDKLIRIPTALVDRYRQYIAAPLADTVGELADAEAAARVRAVLAPALGS
jgi:beta-glucosidase/6-phospho-beta-glucosidase/beta-galactosidase